MSGPSTNWRQRVRIVHCGCGMRHASSSFDVCFVAAIRFSFYGLTAPPSTVLAGAAWTLSKLARPPSQAARLSLRVVIPTPTSAIASSSPEAELSVTRRACISQQLGRLLLLLSFSSVFVLLSFVSACRHDSQPARLGRPRTHLRVSW